MERGVAWDVPETRRSYSAYRLGGLRWLAGGLVGVAAAIGLSAYAVQVLQRPGLGAFIVAAVILGLIGLGTGLGALSRARRFRTALQGAPWRRAELRVAGAHLRLAFATDGTTGSATDGATVGDSVDDADEEGGRRAVDVRLMTTSRWRVREVVRLRGRQVSLCPMSNGSFVLNAEGLDNLYGLRPLARGKAR